MQVKGKLPIGTRLTALCCLFVLIPMLLLSLWLPANWRKTAIEERSRELSRNLYELGLGIDRTAELCNLSTQVFLNTRNLQDHLDRLERGETIPAKELLDFYRNDIASLEKLIVGNPYLHTIRVYSVQRNIAEMMPILFGAERFSQVPWEPDTVASGSWYLDYTDTLFSPAGDAHIMGLLTRVTRDDGTLLGVLEVSVPMQDLMPELFREVPGRRCFLVADSGESCGTETEEAAVALVQADARSASEPVIRETEIDRENVLVGAVYLQDLHSTYYCVESLSSLYQTIHSRQALLLGSILAAAVLLTLAVNAVVRSMLRQLYGVLAGVRSFSEGKLDTVITARSRDEIGIFASQVNDLLENIRQLMQDNMQRGLLVKDTEIRALQNQINAHFIYNVLEAIKMMAEVEENYEIADAVTNLGKLLRYSMKWNRKTASLSEELGYIDNYIALMNLRYDDEIRLSTDVAPELLRQELPRISLQPIVENAVVHGADKKNGVRAIHLTARREEESCIIEITDEGQGLDALQLEKMNRQIEGLEETRSTSGNGIGLNNVQERLRMTFGAEYGITVQSQPGCGTTVRVHLPLRCITGEGQA